jgi:DNA-directed RNA polymerase specialized sigma24 family protein
MHFGDAVPSFDPTVTSIVARRDAVRKVEDVLTRLPPQYREVIRLTQIERLDTSDVAKRLGKSPEAVRALLFRALGAAREAMGRERVAAAGDDASAEPERGRGSARAKEPPEGNPPPRP